MFDKATLDTQGLRGALGMRIRVGFRQELPVLRAKETQRPLKGVRIKVAKADRRYHVFSSLPIEN